MCRPSTPVRYTGSTDYSEPFDQEILIQCAMSWIKVAMHGMTVGDPNCCWTSTVANSWSNWQNVQSQVIRHTCTSHTIELCHNGTRGVLNDLKLYSIKTYTFTMTRTMCDIYGKYQMNERHMLYWQLRIHIYCLTKETLQQKSKLFYSSSNFD